MLLRIKQRKISSFVYHNILWLQLLLQVNCYSVWNYYLVVLFPMYRSQVSSGLLLTALTFYPIVSFLPVVILRLILFFCSFLILKQVLQLYRSRFFECIYFLLFWRAIPFVVPLNNPISAHLWFGLV